MTGFTVYKCWQSRRTTSAQLMPLYRGLREFSPIRTLTSTNKKQPQVGITEGQLGNVLWAYIRLEFTTFGWEEHDITYFSTFWQAQTVSMALHTKLYLLAGSISCFTMLLMIFCLKQYSKAKLSFTEWLNTYYSSTGPIVCLITSLAL